MAFGIQGGVAATVEGDLAQLLTGQAELVHAALADHGDPVDGGDGPVGERPLQEAAESGHPAAAAAWPPMPWRPPVPWARALGDRAVDEDVAGQPGRHGQAGRDDGPHLARPLAAAVVPVERQPQRVLHLGRARAGEAGGAGAHAGVGGQAVDVVAGEPGIGNGGQAALDGEVEVGPTEAAPDGRLADARDDGPAFERLFRVGRSPGARVPWSRRKSGR